MFRSLSAPLRNYFNARFETLSARLAGMESVSSSAQQNLAQVASEVTALRADVARLIEAVSVLEHESALQHEQTLSVVAVLGRSVDLIADTRTGSQEATSIS